jgi:hypothetical protein
MNKLIMVAGLFLSLLLLLAPGCQSSVEGPISSPTTEGNRTNTTSETAVTSTPPPILTSDPQPSTTQILTPNTEPAETTTSHSPSTTTPVTTTTHEQTSSTTTQSTTTTVSPSTTTTVTTQSPDFNSITLSEIQGAYLSSSSIDCNPDQLVPGTILFYRTGEHKYGKMRIIENDDSLVLTWVTLNSYGQTYFENSKSFDKLIQYCNLDSEITNEDEADFSLIQMNETERYLAPLGGALFSILGVIMPIPTGSQEFENTLGAWNSSQSYVTFDGFVVAGSQITGFLQTNTGEGGFTSDWYIQILDPNGNIKRSWSGNQDFSSVSEINFEYEVSTPGFYQVRIINASSGSLAFYLKIESGIWGYYEFGKAQTTWKIVK